MKIIIILTLTLLSTLETTSILNKYNAKIRKMSRNKGNEFNQEGFLNTLILKLSEYTYHPKLTEGKRNDLYWDHVASSFNTLKENFDKLEKINSYEHKIKIQTAN